MPSEFQTMHPRSE